MSGPAGFADPVRDAAATFRALLDAMARPGRVHDAGMTLTPPAPLSPAAAAAALTLVDADAPLWLAPGADGAEVAGWLRFHAGAPPAASPAAARFALGRWPALAAAEGLALGAPDYPDRSATLIVEVDGLAAGAGARLTGPGIDGEARLDVAGVDGGFWAALSLNRARFPLGFDVILTAGTRLAALPRTVRAEA